MLELPAVYATLRQQCNERAHGWPHAEAIRAHFRRDERHVYRPPAFSDGHGPVGVYAMLRENAGALAVLRGCAAAFAQCRASLCAVLTPAQAEQLTRQLLFVPEERAAHMCVTVFHEHPSLLTEEEHRQAWRAVDEAACARLASALSARHALCPRPTLWLDSLSLTVDGACIAGFVEEPRGAFSSLRTSSAEVGVDILGAPLTSRPKALMHVTVGRVLAQPDGITPEQEAQWAACVRKWNDETLPQFVAEIEPRSFELEHCSLVRDSVWLMTDFIEYARWRIGPE
ncbi:hypothetical protein AB1Y20_022425 [Prymnesium parvum]|uniref:Uncharacterized protein n=1 Tax=Prymnesium parvum TaxID=97485 RepID=A0AB34JH23_PRYPA